jgi:hypothetical protein
MDRINSLLDINSLFINGSILLSKKINAKEGDLLIRK